jgi:hypothetical protein
LAQKTRNPPQLFYNVADTHPDWIQESLFGPKKGKIKFKCFEKLSKEVICGAIFSRFLYYNFYFILKGTGTGTCNHLMNKNNFMHSDPDSAKSLDPEPKSLKTKSTIEGLY